METVKYINALESVLQKRFPDRAFSLQGYQECSVCLQFSKDNWLVYCGERGNHYEEVRCDTILMACLCVIRKLTHKTEDISSIENEFLNSLYSQRTA